MRRFDKSIGHKYTAYWYDVAIERLLRRKKLQHVGRGFAGWSFHAWIVKFGDSRVCFVIQHRGPGAPVFDAQFNFDPKFRQSRRSAFREAWKCFESVSL